MYTILILTLIISLFSPAQRSEASNICSDESGRQYILDEKFHTSLKEAVQKNLVNPKNLFTYWAQASNISNNLWDSFDSCLTGSAESSKDACIADWSILSSNFYLFIVDLHHYKTCNLQKFENNAQQLEQISSLIEKVYKESQTFFHNLTQSVLERYLKQDLALTLNKTAISDNERSSARNRTLSCESTVHNLRSQYFNDSLSRLKSGKWSSELEDKFEAEIDNDLDCQKYADKTVISDSEMESFLRTHISSSCERAPLYTKNRIICHWPTLRSRLLEYENGQHPSLVHMKWIPTLVDRSQSEQTNLQLSLYLKYLLNLEKYAVSSYFMLVSMIESDITGRSSDVASWLAHDIGSRIAIDRFSQLRLECQFITNIRSMGYSEISTQVCERLNGAAELLLSNSHVKERISKKLSPAYAAKDRYRDINDALKQLTGRPTRHELNIFLMPHLFRSKREQKLMTAVVRQNDRNLRLIAGFIENNNEPNQVPWLSKISKILEVDTTNCQEISRFLVEFGSADQGIPSFIENAHFLQGKCGNSKDINLWTALGFSFQYENTSLNQLTSSMPSKEPSLEGLSKLSTVALGMSLILLTLENDSPIELEATRAKLSGATDSLLDWLLDMKYENGIDPMESILSGDSGKNPQIRTNDPELIDVLELLSKREGA